MVVNELVRDYLKSFAKAIVNCLIKEILPPNMPKLSMRLGVNRLSWLICGGPASGKSKVVNLVEDMLGRKKRDVVVLNPDYFKELLLHPDDKKDELRSDSSLSHRESVEIIDQIISRILETLEDKEYGPDILFDAARPSGKKIELASIQGGATNLYVVTCPAEIAVRRAFSRGWMQGRFMATSGLLLRHRDVSQLLPTTLSENKLTFELFSSLVPDNQPYLSIARISNRNNKVLQIFDAVKV